MNGQMDANSMDMSALAKLFAQQSEADKKAQLAQQQQAGNVQLGAAGIQAGASLLGGLMQQAAQREIQQKEIEQRGRQQSQQITGESMIKAQQAQQDALSRLMASYRSAL